jgi:hypothetical protein
MEKKGRKSRVKTRILKVSKRTGGGGIILLLFAVPEHMQLESIWSVHGDEMDEHGPIPCPLESLGKREGPCDDSSHDTCQHLFHVHTNVSIMRKPRNQRVEV